MGHLIFLAPQRRLRAGPGTDPLGGLRQDWKRSKKIQMDAQQQMKPPLSHLPDCNFFAYALQDCVFRKYSAGADIKNADELNVYRFILEPGWGQLAVLYGGG